MSFVEINKYLGRLLQFQKIHQSQLFTSFKLANK